jgi:hypothetical protein
MYGVCVVIGMCHVFGVAPPTVQGAASLGDEEQK